MNIIMCAGSASRWGNYKNTLKQMVKVEGEPILQRTIRLLEERGEDYKITVPKLDCFGKLKNQIVGTSETEVDKFINGFNQDSDSFTFIYGDVFWTHNAIDKVLNNKDEFVFFGRDNKSSWFGEIVAREIFAVKITREQFDRIEQYKKEFLDKKIDDCGTWGLYEYLGKPEFVNIDDLTQDFDTPEIYEHFLQVYNRYRI